LCVYSAKQIKRKQIVYGSSVVESDVEEFEPKKIRVLYIFIVYVVYYNIYLLVFNKKFFNLKLDIGI
jgi:hypothetical protein